MEKNEGMSASPIESIWPPKASVFDRITKNKRVTPELVDFLAGQDALVYSYEGEEYAPSLEGALAYIHSEIDFNAKYYPDGFRYKPYLEAKRQETKVLAKSLERGDYKPSLKYCLDESLRELSISRRLVKNYAEKSQEEKNMIEKGRQEQIAAVEKFSKTHNKKDLGMDPELLNISGKKNAAKSLQFYAFAVCFAKEIAKKK
jgi:hypothetical protein